MPDAVIDEAAKWVSVSYDGGERIAVWRPYLGCAQLPSAATEMSLSEVKLTAPEKPPMRFGRAEKRPEIFGGRSGGD